MSTALSYARLRPEPRTVAVLVAGSSSPTEGAPGGENRHRDKSSRKESGGQWQVQFVR